METFTSTERAMLVALRNTIADGAYYDDDTYTNSLTMREEYRAAFWRYLVAARAGEFSEWGN